MEYEQTDKMIDNQYRSLMIDGRIYPKPQLEQLVHKNIAELPQNHWKNKLFTFISEWLSDVATINVKTSGSVGVPQWIEITKENMIKSALLTGAAFNLKKGNKALLCLPVDFIAGKMMVVRAFTLGLNLIPVSPSANPLEKLSNLFDFCAMTPMQVYNVLESPGGEDKLNNIRSLIIGGGEIHSSLKTRISRLRNHTFHTYGMTETITHVAAKKLTGKDSNNFFKALKGVYFKQDKRGCLIIFSKHLTGNQFITNDLVEIKDDTTFEFTGRYDNIINSGGIKISPEKVEQKLKPFIKQRYVIAGIPDESLGQKLVLVVEGIEPVESNLYTIFANTGLEKHAIPKKIMRLKQFPETENGKIIRSEISSLLLK